MSYSRAKWIEEDDSALEVQEDALANLARFVVHQRGADVGGRQFWTPIYWSGLYADIESAEADGRLRWAESRILGFGGMTVNERLSVAGLMRDWERARSLRDRETMVFIMSKVGLQSHAAKIVDSVLAKLA